MPKQPFQSKKMEANVRKLSDQKKELNNKMKKDTIMSTDTNRKDTKNIDDPLLQKFREEGIDV